MQLVGERVTPEADAPSATTIPTPPSSSSPSPTATTTNELISRYAWRQGVLGALTVAIRILAARAILLFAVFGAASLAYLALELGDYLRLAVLGVYLIGAVLPLVWLASRG
jgi:hypothetical protein